MQLTLETMGISKSFTGSVYNGLHEGFKLYLFMRHTDRPTDRQIGRRTDRQTGRQAGKAIDRQIDRYDLYLNKYHKKKHLDHVYR